MIDVEALSTYHAADEMAERGGSFVRALSECFHRADPFNRRTLVNAFEKYFLEYGAKHVDENTPYPIAQNDA